MALTKSTTIIRYITCNRKRGCTSWTDRHKGRHRNSASSLFKLLNFIAEKMISEPKEIQNIYDSLPEIKKEQINKRDSDESK